MTGNEMKIYGDESILRTEMREVYVLPNGGCTPNKSEAMYVCATHRRCDRCGEVMETKVSTLCAECRAVKARERWLALPEKDYDGERVCCFDGEQYFWNDLELECHIDRMLDENPEAGPESLMLVFCEPVPLRELDFIDFADGQLPEDFEGDDIPPKIAFAVEVLNNAIREVGNLSWRPGALRVSSASLAKYFNRVKNARSEEL